MKKTVILLPILLLLVSCTPKKVDTKIFCEEMMKADSDFSKYSEEHGKNAAFLEFAAADVTFLTANTYPLVGIDVLKERQAQRPDTAYVLTWKPTYAKAAQSGDLGYTYGIWEMKMKSDGTISKGTYVTCWERQPNGEWKYVMDTGHEGLGEE